MLWLAGIVHSLNLPCAILLHQFMQRIRVRLRHANILKERHLVCLVRIKQHGVQVGIILQDRIANGPITIHCHHEATHLLQKHCLLSCLEAEEDVAIVDRRRAITADHASRLQVFHRQLCNPGHCYCHQYHLVSSSCDGAQSRLSIWDHLTLKLIGFPRHALNLAESHSPLNRLQHLIEVGLESLCHNTLYRTMRRLSHWRY
mmetsp:Transcript_93522/g.136604  ORF Transcript_93522/g.136604 Transcript_93522/m.136604 type:complete len:202 (-) Transcript_93522:996-1601(-)